MGTTESHIVNARQEKNNFRACVDSEHGNTHGMIQHACLTVEHLLKALVAIDEGGETSTRGHHLGNLLQTVQTDISQFENFVYDLDGMYTQARYDDEFSSGIMNNPERILTTINTFIDYVERVSENPSRM